MIRKLLLLLVVTTILQNTSYGQQAEILANCFYDNSYAPNGRIVIRLAIRNNTGATADFNLVGIRFGIQFDDNVVAFNGYRSYLHNNGTTTALNGASHLTQIGPDTGPAYIGGPNDISTYPAPNDERLATVTGGGTKTLQRRYFNRSVTECNDLWTVQPGTFRLAVDFYFTLNDPSQVGYYNLNNPNYGFGDDEFIAQGMNDHDAPLTDQYKAIGIVLIRNGNSGNPYQLFDFNKCENGMIAPITFDKQQPVNFITPINGVLAGKAIDASVQDKDNHVQIQWKSENNQLVDYFEVQRKDGSGEFKTIGLVMSKEGIAQEQYEFKDKITARDIEPSYRIKVINSDKIITYSDVKKIRLGSEQSVTVKVYPNPSSESVRINLPVSNGVFVCRMYSTEGRMVQVTNVSAANPTVNIKTLQTGSYFMELYQPQTGKRYYTQFSKQ